jgi:serine/threonine-protein kinase
VNRIAPLILLLFLLPPCPSPLAAEEPDGIAALSRTLVETAKKHKKRSLGVTDFTDLNGQVTTAGQYVAEEISTSLAMGGLPVVDRSQINRVLKDQGLSTAGALDPAAARKVGQAAGVDALVTGSVLRIGDTLRITAKLIDTASARMIAASRSTVPVGGALAGLLPQADEKSSTDRPKPPPEAPASPAKRPPAAAEPPPGMVLIPAGSFLYGDQGKEQKIFLPAFWIDRYEVSLDDYNRLRDVEYEPDKGNLPVSDVSWKDAMVYCEIMGKRLPTEQEWEKAARGTDGRLYPWGNAYEPAAVNAQNRHGGPKAVGEFKGGASPYGLFDMAGNVWEWTDSEEDGSKVYRGGSWASPPQDVRTTARNRMALTFKVLDIGFRCAMDTAPR